MAAQTLAEAGKNVLILDGGIHDEQYAQIQPQQDFESLRRNDPQQHWYLLGDRFESLPENDLGTGAQLTPARNYLVEAVDKFLPLAGNFSPMESLALGGLGGGWGLGCCVFSDEELKMAGLAPEKMHGAYQVIADRIGISGADDDARSFTSAGLQNIQAAQKADPVAETILQRYDSKKNQLNREGFFLGRPALALLTEPKDGRKPSALRDMDFYDNKEEAAWRPEITMRRLRKLPNVSYEGGLLVTDFTETDDQIVVNAIRITDGTKINFICRHLILAPGVLGTARIVLRSMPQPEIKLPLLCNPYTYMPCIVPSRLGKKIPAENCAYAQLSLFHKQTETDIAMASMYTYRSLMLFRLLRETPLNFRDGRIFMQHLAPALLIAGIHHPEKLRHGQHLFLEKNNSSPTGDHLHVNYDRGDADEEVTGREKKYSKALRKLGAWPLKKIRPEIGASIHYAGVLPFSEEKKSFTLQPSGKLNGTNNVYVADGSGFKFLPAKGLTLSLMANAHCVVEKVIRATGELGN
jgi:hypothetical protein